MRNRAMLGINYLVCLWMMMLSQTTVFRRDGSDIELCIGLVDEELTGLVFVTGAQRDYWNIRLET